MYVVVHNLPETRIRLHVSEVEVYVYKVDYSAPVLPSHAQIRRYVNYTYNLIVGFRGPFDSSLRKM